MARTRAAVLDAGCAIVREHGWQALSHVSVAQRSGVSRSTLYRHWPDPASLRRAVKQTLSEEGDPAPESLRFGLIEQLEAVRDNLLALAEPAAGGEALRSVEAAARDAEREIAALLSQAIRSGELSATTQPEHEAVRLVAPIVHLGLTRLSGAPDRQIVSMVHDLFETRHIRSTDLQNLSDTRYAPLVPATMATSDAPSTRDRALRALRYAGPVSRAELSRLLGISRSSAGAAVSDLLNDDLVVELPDPQAPAGGPGRPGVLVALNPRGGIAVGIDFGHRHVRVILCDLAHEVRTEREHPLEVDAEPTTSIERALNLLESALEATGITRERIIGVGVGLPGPIDAATGTATRSSISAAWVGFDVAGYVRSELDIPVLLDNDANLGALGEWVYGAGRGERDLIYVKVATGVGSGIISAGRLLRGSHGVAGELGHVCVDAAGPVCRCGNRGCLELFVGAEALRAALRPSHGRLSVGELVGLALDGDRGCQRVIADAGTTLGSALAKVVSVVDPRVVIIGGEVGEAGELFVGPVRTEVRRSAIHVAAAGVQVVPGRLGARASALGAVALVLRELDRYVAVPE